MVKSNLVGTSTLDVILKKEKTVLYFVVMCRNLLIPEGSLGKEVWKDLFNSNSNHGNSHMIMTISVLYWTKSVIVNVKLSSQRTCLT